MILLEALVLGVAGGLVGLGLGRIPAGIAARTVASGGGPALTLPPVGTPDLLIVGAAGLLAIVAALIPALVAYRLEPAQVLRA